MRRLRHLHSRSISIFIHRHDVHAIALKLDRDFFSEFPGAAENSLFLHWSEWVSNVSHTEKLCLRHQIYEYSTSVTRFPRLATKKRLLSFEMYEHSPTTLLEQII